MTQRTWCIGEVEHTDAVDAQDALLTLSRQNLLELRRQAIGFVHLADQLLGLPQTIPDKEDRRRERRPR